jgi:hypothetical protein
MKGIISLSKEVRTVIEEILTVLDTEYSENRDKCNDNGGFAVIAECGKDFEIMKENMQIDCNE